MQSAGGGHQNHVQTSPNRIQLYPGAPLTGPVFGLGQEGNHKFLAILGSDVAVAAFLHSQNFSPFPLSLSQLSHPIIFFRKRLSCDNYWFFQIYIQLFRKSFLLFSFQHHEFRNCLQEKDFSLWCSDAADSSWTLLLSERHQWRISAHTARGSNYPDVDYSNPNYFNYYLFKLFLPKYFVLRREKSSIWLAVHTC